MQRVAWSIRNFSLLFHKWTNIIKSSKQKLEKKLWNSRIALPAQKKKSWGRAELKNEIKYEQNKMKISLNTVKFVSSFIIFSVGIFGEKLENYDHELSTIKLLYYRPT